MEFNAGIFSFTGTRKNPLNIFWLRLLTLTALARDAGRAPHALSGAGLVNLRSWNIFNGL